MNCYATITVIGRDKTGVVARVTNLLFETKANIEALEEQVTRGQFSMTIQASWLVTVFNEKSLGQGLRALGRDLGLEIKWWFTDPKRPQRMALMVTREPHCLDAILESVKSRKLKTEIVAVVGNHRDLKAKVEKAGLPFHHVAWTNRAKAETKALRILEKAQADFVVLARFMKILSPNFVWRFKNKIINIHPSLLPGFPGPQPYRQAHEHGVKIAGVTAHFVSMHLDEGPIIAQESFRIKPGMTLKQIVAAGQKLESKALVNGIRLYLTKQLDVHWGVVKEVYPPGSWRRRLLVEELDVDAAGLGLTLVEAVPERGGEPVRLGRRLRLAKRLALGRKRITQRTLHQFGAVNLHWWQRAEFAGEFLRLHFHCLGGGFSLDQFSRQARHGDCRLAAKALETGLVDDLFAVLLPVLHPQPQHFAALGIAHRADRVGVRHLADIFRVTDRLGDFFLKLVVHFNSACSAGRPSQPQATRHRSRRAVRGHSACRGRDNRPPRRGICSLGDRR